MYIFALFLVSATALSLALAGPIVPKTNDFDVDNIIPDPVGIKIGATANTDAKDPKVDIILPDPVGINT